MNRKSPVAVYLMIIVVIIASFLLSFHGPGTSVAVADGISSNAQYTFYTSNYTTYELLKDYLGKYANVRVISPAATARTAAGGDSRWAVDR
jgi:hypothetical protein